MGRVKVPRCDNCGAPVEFAQGSLEARCEYCSEQLIRELPPPVVPAPPRVVFHEPPRHAPVAPRRTSMAPFLVGGLATVAIAGASGIATLAGQLKPLPDPTPATRDTLAIAAPTKIESESPTARRSETRSDATTERSKSADTTTSKSRRLARPTASAPAAAPTPTEPPKPPPFNTAAAVAGLDAAKAKAEAACRGSDGVRLFVQMGFDPDGANRGAALSDPKLKGTPEAKCALKIFRAVRIPAFDPATRPSGLGRPVRL
jgi:DNA-directed RNA polymerase subunit RPC12/RpoP